MTEKRKKRVAVIVPNPCDPDYRVIKQAEAFREAGYEVQIFAVERGTAPSYETFNGVTYVRRPWNLMSGLLSYLTGAFRNQSPLQALRDKNLKTYDTLMKKRAARLDLAPRADEPQDRDQ